MLDVLDKRAMNTHKRRCLIVLFSILRCNFYKVFCDQIQSFRHEASTINDQLFRLSVYLINALF